MIPLPSYPLLRITHITNSIFIYSHNMFVLRVVVLFSSKFKKAIVTHLIKKASLPNKELRIIVCYQDCVFCQNWSSGWLLNSLCNTSIVTIYTILINQCIKLVTPLKLPDCILKMISLWHLSYLIYRPPLIQSTMILF